MRVPLFLSFLICLASCKYFLVETKGKAGLIKTDDHKWKGIDKLSSDFRSSLGEMVLVPENMGRCIQSHQSRSIFMLKLHILGSSGVNYYAYEVKTVV